MAEQRAVEPQESGGPGQATERRREILLFLFLAVVIWPILSVALVGGYGFLVWMYQLISGPPGPPGI